MQIKHSCLSYPALESCLKFFSLLNVHQDIQKIVQIQRKDVRHPTKDDLKNAAYCARQFLFPAKTFKSILTAKFSPIFMNLLLNYDLLLHGDAHMPHVASYKIAKLFLIL